MLTQQNDSHWLDKKWIQEYDCMLPNERLVKGMWCYTAIRQHSDLKQTRMMWWYKTFSYWCPFVKWIHQLPMDSPHKGPEMQICLYFFVVSLNKTLNKQSNCQWFENYITLCNTEYHNNWGMFYYCSSSHIRPLTILILARILDLLYCSKST